MDTDGTRLTHHIFSVGSGSTYAYGVLDSNYDYEMGVEQARELGNRAIYHATHRDAYSGGVVNCKYMHVPAEDKLENYATSHGKIKKWVNKVLGEIAKDIYSTHILYTNW